MTSRQLTLRSSKQARLEPNLQRLQEHVIRAQNKRVIDEAVNDFLRLRARNGGINKYGDLKDIIGKYHAIGYTFVNRNAINYRLKLRTLDVDNTCNLDNNFTIQFQNTEQSISTCTNPFNEDELVEVDDGCNSTSTSTDRVNKGGRKKGCTKKYYKQQKNNYL
jgi:hypothetical protein